MLAAATPAAAHVGGFHVVVFRGEIRIELAEDFVARPFDVDVEVFEDLGGHAVAFAQEAEEDVLGTDVGVAERLGLLAGEGKDLFHAGCVRNVADHLGLGTGADLFFDLHAHRLEVEAHFGQNVDRHALAQLDQAEQEVFGAHVVVVEPVGLLAGEGEDLLSSWREVVHFSFFFP